MLTQEERRLIPLVAKRGCVDIRILKTSYEKVKNIKTIELRHRLFIYHYLKEIDTDGDEPMLDFSPSSSSSQ